jgi:hypothetical protein
MRSIVKSLHISYVALLAALGQLLIAASSGDQKAVAASLTAVILAFLPAVWPSPTKGPDVPIVAA